MVAKGERDMQPMLVSQFGEAHFQEYSSTILIISDAPCDTVLENVLEGFGVRVLGVSPVEIGRAHV